MNRRHQPITYRDNPKLKENMALAASFNGADSFTGYMTVAHQHVDYKGKPFQSITLHPINEERPLNALGEPFVPAEVRLFEEVPEDEQCTATWEGGHCHRRKGKTRKALCEGHYTQKRTGREFSELRIIRPRGYDHDQMRNWYRENVIVKQASDTGWVENDTPCWIWQGHHFENGYALDKYENITYTVQGLSYRLFNDDWDGWEGMDASHLCGPAKECKHCVNPDHLVKAPHADNVRDAAAKQTLTHGEDHHEAILNDDIIRIIRGLLNLPREHRPSQKQMGVMFGVSETAIYDVKVGRTWKNVDASKDLDYLKRLAKESN